MTDDLYLLASEAPGILDGWTGPVSIRDPLGEESGFVHGGRFFSFTRSDGEPSEWTPGHPLVEYRLDFRLPEVRDRAVRWGVEHDTRSFSANYDRDYWLALRDDPAALLAEVRAVAAASVSPTPPGDVAGVKSPGNEPPGSPAPSDPDWTYSGQRIDRVNLALTRDRRGRVVDVTERAQREIDEARQVDLTPDLTSGPGGQHKAPATAGKGA